MINSGEIRLYDGVSLLGSEINTNIVIDNELQSFRGRNANLYQNTITDYTLDAEFNFTNDSISKLYFYMQTNKKIEMNIRVPENGVVYYGLVLITNISNLFQNQQVARINLTLQGYGALNIITSQSIEIPGTNLLQANLLKDKDNNLIISRDQNTFIGKYFPFGNQVYEQLLRFDFLVKEIRTYGNFDYYLSEDQEKLQKVDEQGRQLALYDEEEVIIDFQVAGLIRPITNLVVEDGANITVRFLDEDLGLNDSYILPAALTTQALNYKWVGNMLMMIVYEDIFKIVEFFDPTDTAGTHNVIYSSPALWQATSAEIVLDNLGNAYVFTISFLKTIRYIESINTSSPTSKLVSKQLSLNASSKFKTFGNLVMHLLSIGASTENEIYYKGQRILYNDTLSGDTQSIEMNDNGLMILIDDDGADLNLRYLMPHEYVEDPVQARLILDLL